MYREFISTSEEKKLAIFKHICNTSGCTILELSETMGIPSKSVQKYIYALEEDLHFLTCTVSLKKNIHNQYYLDQKEQTPQPCYAQLTEYYLQHASKYQLVLYLIGHANSSLNHLCSALHISQSHVYRLLAKVNQFLQKFHISINTSEDKIIEFAGNERDIRIFIYSFLTQSAPADRFIAPTLSLNDAETFLNFFDPYALDQLTQNKLLAFWQTIVHRCFQKKYLPPIPKEYQSLLQFYSFLPENIVDTLPIHAAYLKKDCKQAEYLYLNFFLHVFLPAVVDKGKLKRITAAIMQSDSPLVTFFVGMIHTWQQRFAPTMAQTEFEQLLNSCLLVFNLSILIDINLMHVWHLDNDLLLADTEHHDVQLYNDIVDLLILKANHYPFTDFDKTFFVQKQLPYFAHLLYLESQMLKSADVKIYIRTTIQYRTKKTIETRIRTLYTESAISFVDDMTQSDLIITDSYEDVAVTDKLLLVTNLMNPGEWEILLAKINQVITHKLLSVSSSQQQSSISIPQK
ncbi:helix-turn-helix domain-containing protein [Enterococcus sp. DIV0876]|uniref:helix-turn-helix domain-containing protein n=1 Tax=Enterococcus sp. DIV0876 TaxID=2774633 RepID=UPI003D2FB8AE